MKRLLLVGAVAAVAFAAPAWAQQDLTTDPARVRAGRYTVEPDHTQIEFAVSHMGFTTYFGRFSGASGRLDLDPAAPAAIRLAVRVPAASISTTSDALNGMLRGPQWLDAARFPEIAFRSTRVIPAGAGRAEVQGELTLHGVTRPLTLQVRFQGAGTNPLDNRYTVGFAATGRIRRSEFGITTYVPLVGDEVDLTLSGAFEQEG